MSINQSGGNTGSSRKTIITGSMRSGTTLALRVYCKDLTSTQEWHHSDVNEPRDLWSAIRDGDIESAKKHVSRFLLNEHHLIKSPHVAFVLPYLAPDYDVIVTFRDFRLTIPSMLAHPNIPKYDLTVEIFWEKYRDQVMPADPVDKALSLSQGLYESAIRYQGPMRVWNYGFWNGWNVKNEAIGHLYDRGLRETSKRVLEEVKKGTMFSNQSFHIKVWKDFCEKSGITKSQQNAVCDANEHIKEIYKKRQLQVKTLDDVT